LPKIPGVNHLDAVRALQKAGFRIASAHRHHSSPQSVSAFTMGGIARDAGLTVEQFRALL
jgi:hypothetical protein